MATIIPTIGLPCELTIIDRIDHTALELVQSVVGTPISSVQFPAAQTVLYFQTPNPNTGKAINVSATALLASTPRQQYNYVYGPAVLCSFAEAGLSEEHA
jgi:hypothetical protein